MAFGIDPSRASPEEVLRMLHNMDDQSFDDLCTAALGNCLEAVYGSRVAAALDIALLNRVKQDREAKAARIKMRGAAQIVAKAAGVNDAYTNLLPQTSPLFPLSGPLEESAREKALRLRAEQAEAELENIKRRFESMFKVPAGACHLAVTQDPKIPEQWRIRLSVAPFTVETTMGDLTAARQNPALAATWGDNLKRMAELQQAAFGQQWKLIANHIITYPHPITSAEPNEPEQPQYNVDSKRGFR